jgi:hypothetical protein
VIEARPDSRGTPRIHVPVHKGQMRALRSTRKITAVLAGSGGGKTTIGPIWLVRRIARYWDDAPERQQYLVAAPTNDLLGPALAALSPYLKVLGNPTIGEEGNGYTPSHREHGHSWHLRNGAIVYFRSADRPGALEGRHYRAAWADEWGQVDDTAHATLIRRLGFYNGDLLITTTPYVAEGWTAELVAAHRAGDEDIELIQFPSVLNPGYSIKEWRRLKATMPPWLFAMFFRGLLTRPEGAAYPNFDPAVHVEDPFEQPEGLVGWAHYAGMDFGLAHPTAIIRGLLSPSGALHLDREYVEEGVVESDIAHELQSMKVKLAFADPAAAQVIEGVRRHKCESCTGRTPPIQTEPLGGGKLNDVIAGVAEVYGRLASRALRLMRGRVPRTIGGIERLRWDKDRRSLVKRDDDEADAVRYLCMGLARKRGRLHVAKRATAPRGQRPATANLMQRPF